MLVCMFMMLFFWVWIMIVGDGFMMYLLMCVWLLYLVVVCIWCVFYVDVVLGVCLLVGLLDVEFVLVVLEWFVVVFWEMDEVGRVVVFGIDGVLIVFVFG